LRILQILFNQPDPVADDREDDHREDYDEFEHFGNKRRPHRPSFILSI
jgi:hypothetical protein